MSTCHVFSSKRPTAHRGVDSFETNDASTGKNII